MRPVVVITGASVGLGLAIAKQLISEDKYHLVLTARERSLPRFGNEDIQESRHVSIMALDVTNRKQREVLVEKILWRFGHIDYLINNAGVAYRTVVEHIEPYELVRQMAINFYAPLEMIRLVLPNMRSRKEGHIINISSVSGMMAMPTMGLYSSSKFALEALSEALWYEVKPWNIKVTLVEPGFIRSEAFTKVPLSRKAKVVRSNDQCPYNNHYRSMAPFVAKMMGLAFAKPKNVAKKVSKIMKRKRPPLRQPATFDAYLFHLLKKVLPSSIYLRLLYWTLPDSKNWGNEDVVESDFANFILKKNEEAKTAVNNLDFVDSKNLPGKKKTATGYKTKIVN